MPAFRGVANECQEAASAFTHLACLVVGVDVTGGVDAHRRMVGVVGAGGARQIKSAGALVARSVHVKSAKFGHVLAVARVLVGTGPSAPRKHGAHQQPRET